MTITIEKQDLKNVTPNDYAVHLSNLPRALYRDGKRLTLPECEQALTTHLTAILQQTVGKYRKNITAEQKKRLKTEMAREQWQSEVRW